MPKNKQQEAQEKRLQKNIRQAKKTRADAKQGKTKSARSKPSKKGGFFAGLKADAPQTVQQSIPYREMYRDGICRLTDTLYTKTVQFFDINYQLAQADDKAQIFEGYCDFLNYFDASIHVQLTFINQRANMQDFTRSIDIPPRGDEYDGIRREYVYFAFELIHEDDLTKLNTRMYIYFMINGILLLFAYPLLFLLEKIFGFTSDVTLVELSNINNSLLREMSEVAPGTFQHSLQMANLAAAAANKIGGKSQLVRTGALYHDIGKMVNPAFFTENQSGVNPHKSLSYEQSAQVIISHITDGLKLAEKHNLPKVIKDFISTHHGRGLTKYFYISYKNEHPDEEVDEEKFRYPGPNPFTKEQAVLMMADSVEAASRSLPEYTEESISTLVDKIIDTQVSEGYFKECPITFKDIATVKALFKEKLKTMYHTRISYPELRK